MDLDRQGIAELDAWLAPFLTVNGRKTRRTRAPLYLWGLLGPELAGQANRLVGGPDACLVIDDTALPKKGARSVGVARQYFAALGKQANCQSLVSLTLAQDEVPVAVGLRPFLPEAWTSDPQRCLQAGVP